MATGVVVEFTTEQGRGLIRTVDGRSVGVDTTDVLTRGMPALAEGMTVEFDVVVTARGEQARNVTVVRSPTAGRNRGEHDEGGR